MFNNKLKEQIRDLELRVKVLEEANMLAANCTMLLTNKVRDLHNSQLDKIEELALRLTRLECKREKKCTREKKSKK